MSKSKFKTELKIRWAMNIYYYRKQILISVDYKKFVVFLILIFIEIKMKL